MKRRIPNLALGYKFNIYGTDVYFNYVVFKLPFFFSRIVLIHI